MGRLSVAARYVADRGRIMTASLSELLSVIESLSPFLLYVFFFAIAYGENVVPPVPGDLAIVYGGYLAGIGLLNVWVLILLATVGGTLGFVTMYAVGRRFGPAVRDPARMRWVPKRRIRQAAVWMRRWGLGVVAANRFLSGTRSVIALTAGMAHLPAGRTVFLAGLSALVWTATICIAGFLVGDNWAQVVRVINIYGNIILGVLFILFVLLAAGYWRRRRTKSMKTPSGGGGG